MPPLHVVCPQCHTVNRVPTERLGSDPKCGACKAMILDGQPVELAGGSFATHIERSDLPVVVDFWAPWCGPCRTMAPAFAQAAQHLRGRAQLAKVNTEAESMLANRFGIRGIPTLVVFRRGQEVGRMSGVLDARRLVDWINGWL